MFLGAPRARLGQPEGDVLSIDHTRNLLPGDLLWVNFKTGSNGWFRYGSEEVFEIISVDAQTGDLTTRDETGAETTFAGGTREEMLARLSALTSFWSVEAVRPVPPTPIDEQLRLLADEVGAGTYKRVPITTWADLLPGDYVALAPPSGYARVVLVTSPPLQGFVWGELVYTTSPEEEIGQDWLLDAGHFVGPEEAPFRSGGAGETLAKIPGWAIVGGAGAVLLLLFLPR